MTIRIRLIVAMLMSIVALSLASCGSRSIEGTYKATVLR